MTRIERYASCEEKVNHVQSYKERLIYQSILDGIQIIQESAAKLLWKRR